MNKEVVLATNNKHKLREYREILAPMGFLIYSPSDLNIEVDPIENGADYKENSLIKAKALIKLVNRPVISDDSGLEIKALSSFPGLNSARFASTFPSYKEAWAEIIRRLEGQKDRSAQFVCTICYLENENAKPLYFEGICPGYILDKPTGENGFGYDPIFHSEEGNIDFGLASEETKNKYSHRAKAIAKLKIFLAIKD